MAYKPKTWQQKMHPKFSAKTEVTTKKFADIPAGATMFIATPMIVDAYIRSIPFGTFTSLQLMRKDLAAENNAEYSCPITSGIFLRIAAEAAWEEMEAGKSIDEVTPFWRIMDPKSPSAKKLSFGTEWLINQQKKEGINIPSGKIPSKIIKAKTKV